MKFLTKYEVAKMFKVHPRTVERWIATRLLKGYKLGKGRTALLRISDTEIKKFLEKSKSKK